MAISLSKKKSTRQSSKRLVVDHHHQQQQQQQQHCLILYTFLSRIPITVLILFLVFLWSSSTTIISGNIVHVCVSSRKLNNLYCLSAGAAQPNFNIPIPIINNNDNDNNGTFSTSSRTIVSYNSTSVIDDNINGIDVDNDFMKDIVHDKKDSSGGGDDDEEVANAIKEVEEQLRVHRLSSKKYLSHTTSSCDGRGIYVYDLPSKFNKDLMGQCNEMVPWMVDFCKHFKNQGLGDPLQNLGKGWYNTHQYALEPIFHSRVSNHACRVYNQDEAKLFVVPFYGGLDVLRWHFKSNVSDEVKDELSVQIVKWLETQQQTWWTRNSGKDHVFVLGKISWDFRRKPERKRDSPSSAWGTKFLELDELQNPIKLLIERHPWHINDIGVPHPTHFHPHSDEDITTWQSKIIVQSNRKTLVGFAGAARPGAPENIRSILIKQCTSSPEQCRFLDCNSGGCDQPESVINLFTESEFCLQPPGDSPTRKSVFDSLVSGCIPVLFDPFTAYYQYPWHLPEDHGKYSVFIDKEEVRDEKKKVNVVERLMKVSEKERAEMRRYIVYELMPGLVYGDSNSKFEKFEDAFLITINNLFQRVLTKLD